MSTITEKIESLQDSTQVCHHQAQLEPDNKPARKRRRTVISCTECHRRKQKCDRNLPCSNCVSRGKTSVCHYESEATIIKRHSQSGDGAAPNSSDGGSPAAHGRRKLDDSARPEPDAAAQQLSALGYTKSNGMNTLGFVEKIQSHGRDGRMQIENIIRPENGLREKYKNLIRQLPSRSYVEQMIETFFREINWHYCSLDRFAFDQHLQGWLNISFSVLNKGPQELPAELRFFPALLFQVLALTLQFHNPGQDSSLDCLKYVKEMTLDDLASDYSESGADILKLLGKRDLTLVAVQAGFLRTLFLKNSGNITEAWHALSATIRDAQEIGLHKNLGIGGSHATSEQALEDLWHLEDRRRLWLILSCWDPHMAIVLGRPTTIDCRDSSLTPPIDARPNVDRKTSGPIPRSSDDPPTPLTMMLLVNGTGIELLRSILALEKEGPYPGDYSRVENLHEDIVNMLGCPPAYFRSENPDTAFDDRPECHWLSECRPIIDTFKNFVLMSLHRPYVFTIARSRVDALKAGLNILRAQRRFFQYLQAKHYKMFNLVLTTFDAIVLVAAVYIMYPRDNAEFLGDSLQHFEWAMERLETMSERNPMAKAALGVLQAIHIRLMKALGHRGTKRGPHSPSAASPISSIVQGSALGSTNGHSGSNPSRGSSISANSVSSSTAIGQALLHPFDSHHNIQPDLERLQAAPTSIPDQVPPYQAGIGPWPSSYANPLLSSFDGTNHNLGNIAPLQPLHDLLFNDLVGMSDASAPSIAANSSTLYDSRVPWKFEGEFENDSFWNFMNQYHNP